MPRARECERWRAPHARHHRRHHRSL